MNAEGLAQYTDGRPQSTHQSHPGVGAHEEPMATEASGTLVLSLDQKHASWGLNFLGASVLDATMQNVVSTHRSPSGPLALGCS